MTDLLVAGQRITYADAEQAVRTYTTLARGAKEDFYSYPYYDRFEAGSGAKELNDGDLLAPVLMNARLTIRGFHFLQGLAPKLSDALSDIPVGMSLATHRDPERLRGDPERLRALFEPLDDVPGKERWGVQGTTLAKVLHRKRPRFIPLYDKKIGTLFTGRPDAPLYRAPRGPRRGWGEFFVLLGTAIQSDLQSQPDGWESLTKLAEGLTELRAYDIVAWKVAGRK